MCLPTDGIGALVHDSTLRSSGSSRVEIRYRAAWMKPVHPLYKDEKDAALHQRAIERLARRVNRPIEQAKIAYEDEYARLKTESKVTNFLGVLASRRARVVLLRTPA